MAPPKGKGKVTKKKIVSSREQYTMRIVESSTCAVCKTQCTRGLRYLEHMSQPGLLVEGFHVF